MDPKDIIVDGTQAGSWLWLYPVMEGDRIIFHAHHDASGDKSSGTVVSVNLPDARRLCDQLHAMIRELEVP